jgi:hypothetical protein
MPQFATDTQFCELLKIHHEPFGGRKIAKSVRESPPEIALSGIAAYRMLKSAGRKKFSGDPIKWNGLLTLSFG